MTAEDIARVRADFEIVGPIGEEVGLELYRRLFAADPAMWDLFGDDLKAQAAHLMAALGSVVSSLDDPAAIEPEIRALARRHVAYRVKEEHFALVGAALIAALEAGLGDEFTVEAKAAWTQAYEGLSRSMIIEMRDVASKQ